MPILSIRVSDGERARLVEQADLAGITLSELVRRRALGGPPVVAKTDEAVIRELRRLGGLLKATWSRTGGDQSPYGRDTAEALRLLKAAIERVAGGGGR